MHKKEIKRRRKKEINQNKSKIQQNDKLIKMCNEIEEGWKVKT